MVKEATIPKSSMRREWYCLAVHKNTRKRTTEYTGAEEQTVEKVGFRHLLSSFFFLLSSFSYKLLTSIAYKLKQILSYFTHRTSLSSQQPLSARLSANWQEWRFWLAVVLRSSNTTPFWATNKRSRFRRVPIVHAQLTCEVAMQTHFITPCLWWLCSRCLPNPSQSDIWWLMTARKNSCQPVLVRIYRNCAIKEAWLPFRTCRICILRTLLSGWSFLFMIMQIVEPLQSLQAWLSWSSLMNTPPPSPLRWWW